MESKEGIEALFLHATEGILVVDESGDIVMCNPAAERLFGYQREELIGQKIEVLIPRRYSHIHKKHRENYAGDPHPRAMGLGRDLYALKKNGAEFPVEISLSPYATKTERFVIAFIIDITLRKEAEENLKNYSADLERQVKDRTMILEEAIAELEKTKATLHEALTKEKELNELKSRFVSMASHEFRTPLATMLSSLALIGKYAELNDKEKLFKHIGKAKSSIQNLTDILDDFLSVSKLEEGKVFNKTEKFDLELFIEDVVHDITPLSKKGQKIYYKHEGERIVVLDPRLLKNIMFNLISNAIKFSEEGKSIRITSEKKESELLIKVVDEGIGIPKADQKHLFGRFVRGHNATHIQGTGLGLNIVSKYVELMGGSIDFESRENEGTTFVITFDQ